MDMNYAKIMYEPSLQHHIFRLDPPYNIKKILVHGVEGGGKKMLYGGRRGVKWSSSRPPPQLKMEQP